MTDRSTRATRDRVLAATLDCFERWGLAKTSLEDVAREAGLSRATVYRYFPGGRDQVVSETISWEVARFWTRLAVEIAEHEGLEAKLERGLSFGHRAIGEHKLLQQILRTEPELLLLEMNASAVLVEVLVRDTVASLLRSERLRAEVELAEAADYVARMFLSLMMSPGGWDLDDPRQVVELVRTQILAGVVDLT